MLMAAATLLTSCSMDDMFEGKEENITIMDKNSGTLQVSEPYANEACRFESARGEVNLGNAIYAFRAIEFLASGVCLVECGDSFTTTYGVESDGTYRFVLKDGAEGTVKDGVLTVTDYSYPEDDSQRYPRAALNKVEMPDASDITRRLCHTWELKQGIVKMYNGDKLVMTSRLEEYELYDSESLITFSPVGTFLSSYQMEDGISGVGTWSWTNEGQQQVTYSKMSYDYEENTNATLYFSGNNLYVEKEEMEMDYDDEYADEDEEGFEYNRVVTLYKYEVVSSNE